jgi:hypothetical protein
MEDVLDLYNGTVKENEARIVFDEKPCQLIGDVIQPLPMEPEKVLREDYEYKRKGTACILLAYDLDTHKSLSMEQNKERRLGSSPKSYPGNHNYRARLSEKRV